MATLVLAAVGSGLGLTGASLAVVTAAGTALGSYLDQNYFFPPPDIEAPKFGDLRAQAGSEGMPLNYTLGPKCRVPGKVISVGPIFPFVSGSQMFANVGIDCCAGPLDDDWGLEVFANGQSVYKLDPDVTIVSALLRASVGLAPPHANVNTGTAKVYQMLITSEVPGPDLTELESGRDLQVSGFATPGLNHTWRVIRSNISPFNQNETEVLVVRVFQVTEWSVAPPANEASGATVTLFQVLAQWNTNIFYGITFYNGANTQGPDPVMEADFGVGNVHSRRGRAWVMIHSMNVTKLGGSVPNFEIVLRQSVTMTVAEALDALLARTGLDPSFWDTTAVTGSFLGLVAEEPIDSKALIQAVMMVYRVMAREVEGQITFYMRDGSDVIVVDSADLAAHEVDGKPDARLVAFEDKADLDLPSRVEVEFSNADKGLQQGNARETHHGLQVDSTKVLRVRTPLTLTEAEAATFARQLMMDAYANRQRRSTSLPPGYLHMCEGDIWTTDIDGQKLTSIATKVEYGSNGLIQVAGTQEQLQVQKIESSEVDVEGSATGPPGFHLPLNLELYLSDAAPLNDADAIRPGIYWGAPDYATGQPFTGGALFQRLPGAVEFVQQDPVPDLIPYGRVLGTDHAWLGANDSYWDRRSELVVTVEGGLQLSSSTEDAVVGGANWAFYGDEVIAWVSATDQGDGTYKLTNLLRGLRGTEWAIAGHTAVEAFVPVAGLIFHEMPQSSFGLTVGLKAVGADWDEADVDEVTLVPAFGSITPFPVYSVRGGRDGANDLAVSWERQTRALQPIFGGVEAPLLEAAESYEIDVIDGGSPTTNSPYFAGVAKTWSYSASEQTADGLTPGDPVTVHVYQIGSLGRGRVKEAVL